MILITGATGNLGKRVAEIIQEQGYALRLMVRDKRRSPQIAGAEVVEADYSKPETLNIALEGVDAALVVSGHAEPMKRALLHKNVFDAAARMQVKNIVYTSFQGASLDSQFPFARDHYQTERYLEACGVPFTALRNNLYLDLAAEFFNKDGVVLGPAGQGAVAWVAREDIAQVAATCLSATPTGEIVDVTGPEALTLHETAARISALVNRKLSYEEETVEQGRKWRSEFDVPEWEVDAWLGSYEAIAAGELASTSDAILRFTGHPPIGLEAYYAKHPHLLASLKEE